VTRPADVIVAGAGPSGCATAIHLARAGFDVLLLDRARFPRDKPCAEYLSPETLRHLDGLGALDPLDGYDGVKLRGTTVLGVLGSQLTGHFANAGHTPFRPTGLAIRRQVLDAELVRAARREGVRVRDPEGNEYLDLFSEGIPQLIGAPTLTEVLGASLDRFAALLHEH